MIRSQRCSYKPLSWQTAIVALSIWLSSSGIAPAVVVVGDSTNGNGTGNTTPPVGSGNDPGFYHVGILAGGSIVYLGNRWALTADHVNTSGRQPTFLINGGTSSATYPIMNSVDSVFANSGSLAGTVADLRLVSLDADPGLSSLAIASSPPAFNSTVIMVGNGRTTTGPVYFPNVAVNVGGGTATVTLGASQPTAPNPPVDPLPAVDSSNFTTGTFQAAGFGDSSPNQTIRWGQNSITQTGAIATYQYNNSTYNTKAFYTTFNDPTYSNGQPNVASEAQASNGDSGGAVFSGSAGSWTLSGVMLAINSYPGNANAYALYGESTYIANLSNYRSTILDVITPLPWTGQSSSSWDTSSLSLNWMSGVTPVSYHNVTSAEFDDTIPITGAPITNASIVIGPASGVSPASVTFNNSLVNYSFSDAAGNTLGITGSTGIVKNGTAMVTLAGANSFTSQVMINAGRINVQNSSGLGTASLVNVSPGAALELQGGVSIGPLPLTLAGTGLASNPGGSLRSVSGANSFSGSISLAAGGATIGSTTAGATLTLSGGISTTLPNTATGLPLTFAGAGNTSITGAISGNGSVTMSGTGGLNLSVANSYAGGTTVNSGTVTVSGAGTLGNITGGLTINAASGVTSSVILNSNQTIGGLSGAVTGNGAALVNIAGGVTLVDNQTSGGVFGGNLIDSGNFTKSGVGTLELDGAPTLNAGSALTVNTGTLMFNVNSGMATIGSSGVTVSVANAATLELAGTVSALSGSGNYAGINNASTAAAGVLVSGTNQQVGQITGSGTTQLAAGASLTATSITQNSLVIGQGGVFSLRATNSAGNGIALDAASATFGGGGSIAATISAANANLQPLLLSRSAVTSPLSAVAASSANVPFADFAVSTTTAGNVMLGSGATGLASGGNSSTQNGAASLGQGGLSLQPNFSVAPEPSTIVLLGMACLIFAARPARRFFTGSFRAHLPPA